MKATMQSTDRVVDVDVPRGSPPPSGKASDGAASGGAGMAGQDVASVMIRARARVWEGVTAGGVRFVAYISLVQVENAADQTEFEESLGEHVQASPATLKAIDARFIL